MKRLIFVCGPNGVGKSTACRALVEALPAAAYVDSDWCRAMHPFAFDEETIGLVRANIVALLGNYFRAPFIEDVIFSYGLHGPRKRIFDDVLGALEAMEIAYRLCPLILTCDPADQIARMQADARDDARIRRAIENTRAIYAAYDYPTVDATGLTVPQTVERIVRVLAERYGVQPRG
ncbi:MAG: AAA family ATPase [Chloroflexi bacterium]|nr:AAA family ATPase [Chloroflexota bacterium]